MNSNQCKKVEKLFLESKFREVTDPIQLNFKLKMVPHPEKRESLYCKPLEIIWQDEQKFVFKLDRGGDFAEYYLYFIQSGNYFELLLNE